MYAALLPFKQPCLCIAKFEINFTEIFHIVCNQGQHGVKDPADLL